MAKKKKRLIWTAEDQARSAEIKRMLEERIAILGRKIAEQKRREGGAQA
jgi:hypothetical protein